MQPYGRKTTIPWGRFCYGPTADAYGDLAERLDPKRPEKTAPSHPIAVYGTVQRVHRDRKGRPFVYLADHGDQDGKEFEVVLRSMHPTLIKPLTVGTHVLAVGKWKVFNGSRVPQLVLFADEAWQIAYWHSDEDTGTASQPTSPPALTEHQRATERPVRTPPTRARRPTATKAAGRRSGVPTRRTTTPPPAKPRTAPPSVLTPPADAAPDSTQQRPQPPAPAAPQSPLAGPPRTPPPAPAVPPADQKPIMPAMPPAPPKPSRPPRVASPPLPPQRRRRAQLANWLRRRKKRRD